MTLLHRAVRRLAPQPPSDPVETVAERPPQPPGVGWFRDGRRATSSTTGSGVVSRRSQSDLLNHREWTGFETVAERPPQPPGVGWSRDGRRATSSTTGSGVVSRRSQSDLLNHREWFRDGRRATSSATGGAGDLLNHQAVEGRREVCPEVLDVLDPHAEAYQPVGDRGRVGL